MNPTFECAKYAEVQGALKAFHDAGLLKFANANAYANLCGAVSDCLGDEDYDLQKVAAVTEAVLCNGDNMNNITIARNAALGELFLAKTAGEISDRQFINAAASVIKTAEDAAPKAPLWDRIKGHVGQHGKKYSAGAGLGTGIGATLLANYLYNKFRSPSPSSLENLDVPLE